MTTPFKYLLKNIGEDYQYNKYSNLILLEIAYQLKRLADKQLSKEDGR